MNTIDDLRQIIGETIKDVRSGKLDADKAKLINDLCKTAVNSAKAENDYMRISGGRGSGFIPDRQALPQQPDPQPEAKPEAHKLPNGVHRTVEQRNGATVTRNVMR